MSEELATFGHDDPRSASALRVSMRLVRDANEEYLKALCSADGRSVTAPTGYPPVSPLTESQIRFAAAMPYLISDFSFAELGQWSAWTQQKNRPGSEARARHESATARTVLTTAWLICHQDKRIAGLVLGAPLRVAYLIAELRLPEIESIANAHPERLQPRWHYHKAFWLAYADAARKSDAPRLAQLSGYGLQLLAGAVLRHAPQSPEVPVASVAPCVPARGRDAQGARGLQSLSSR